MHPIRRPLAVLAAALLLPSALLAAPDKPKKPAATIKAEPSVRVEGGEVLTVAPIPGAGLPTESAIPGAKAYELLRAAARKLRPSAHLYTLSTGMHGLSPEGASSLWSAEFITDTPGEMVIVMFEEGEISEPFLSDAPLGRDGVPEPDLVGYDTKKLYQETVRRSTAAMADPITRVTASLYRSAGDGKALWLLDAFRNEDDDERIGCTVVFEAKTMAFSHQVTR